MNLSQDISSSSSSRPFVSVPDQSQTDTFEAATLLFYSRQTQNLERLDRELAHFLSAIRKNNASNYESRYKRGIVDKLEESRIQVPPGATSELNPE